MVKTHLNVKKDSSQKPPSMNRSMDNYIIKPIAHIYTDFNERFGIPRQPGLAASLTARIVFEEEFRDMNSIKDIEGFSHLWLIWGFSETSVNMQESPVRWSPLVTPPRLGGKTKVGVFASRSPYRPNSLGLSSVRLISVDSECDNAPVLTVSGADILNGTPVYDIKPYVPYTDCHPDAVGGFAVSKVSFLKVVFPEDLLKIVAADKRQALLEVLSQDPRGSYEKQPGYQYGLSFADYDIRFTVDGDTLTVFEVIEINSSGQGVDKIK